MLSNRCVLKPPSTQQPVHLMKTLLWFRISAVYAYSSVMLESPRSEKGWERMRAKKLPELRVRERLSQKQVPQGSREQRED